ncbi:uncharacterized protein GBIM_18134 [Gryllus bimaculatus]|nr:uncharacterized protein GBIM_18134 [Gryllus bimaculatus]
MGENDWKREHKVACVRAAAGGPVGAAAAGGGGKSLCGDAERSGSGVQPWRARAEERPACLGLWLGGWRVWRGVRVAGAGRVRGRGALRDAGAFRLPAHARIFGGVNASAHEFPAQHSVRTVLGFGTANKQRLEYQVAARVIPHEEYVLYGRNDNNAENDVGLVEASERLPLDGRAVAAARLPDALHPLPRGRGVVVTGWGRWTYDDLQAHPGSTAVLKKLDVHIFPCPGDVSHVICIQTDAGTGICDGDSGGPLMVNGVFYGVASYVDNVNDDPMLDPNLHCNEVGSWAVYMSVQAYRPWIHQHTGI